MNTEFIWRLAFGVWRLVFGPAQRPPFSGHAFRCDGACGGLNSKRQTPNAKRQTILLCALLVICGLLSQRADAAETAKGYDAFRLMQTRNIFDPNRRPVRIEAPRSSAPRTRSSSFTLTGTMVRDGRSLAFFSGTRSEFSKVIGVGDSVANFKIASIEPSQVELEHEGKKVALAIGQPFKIEAQPGDPVEADEPEDAAKTEGTDGTKTTDGTNAPATPGASPTTPPASSGSGNSKDEIMRRMMERRAKEQGK